MSDPMLRASLECDVRGIDEEKRQATFVASTERAVMTWAGPEVLRMKGARLKRFKKNPVALDSHSRFSLESVIGRADVEVVGRQLHTTITYSTVARGELAWQLVKEGTVRAVSIGYMPNRQKTRVLQQGEHDGEGEDRVEGPALVVREWELLEISNVPIPADEDAVRRDFYGPIFNQPQRRAPMELSTVMGERDSAPAPTEGQAPPVAKPAPSTQVVAEIPEERAARVLEGRRRQILAICPRGLEHVAEGALLAGDDVEAARAKLVAAQAARSKPVGTPEPAEIEAAQASNTDDDTPPEAERLSDDVLERSFKNLRS